MHSDILKKAVTRALADANIASIVGDKVYTNVPKDTAPPYVRVQWSNVTDISDKTSEFVQGELTFDFWTDEYSDVQVLDMIDYINDEFNNSVLVLTEGSTNLLCTRTGYNTFLEGDGLSHHGIITFNLLIED